MKKKVWKWSRRLATLALALAVMAALAMPASACEVGYDGFFAAGRDFTLWLLKDGRVLSFGMEQDWADQVSELRGITQISAFDHVVALDQDGTVFTVGENRYGRCDAYGWQDIQQVAAGVRNTVGLKKDGTVLVAGDNSFGQFGAREWEQVKQVAVGGLTVYGLLENGTVVAAGSNAYGQANVSGWKNIQSISAGSTHIVGITGDMTAVAAGSNRFGQCNVENWKDLVCVSAGSNHTLGLTVYQSAVATGRNSCGQCDVEQWKSVHAIHAAFDQSIAVDYERNIHRAGNEKNTPVPAYVAMLANPGSSYDIGEYIQSHPLDMQSYIERKLKLEEPPKTQFGYDGEMMYATRFSFFPAVGDQVSGVILTDRRCPFSLALRTDLSGEHRTTEAYYLREYLDFAKLYVWDANRTEDDPMYRQIQANAGKDRVEFFDIGEGFRLRIEKEYNGHLSMVLYPKSCEENMDFDGLWYMR